jgi:hypothetical protein
MIPHTLTMISRVRENSEVLMKFTQIVMDFTRLSWEYHVTNCLTHMICGLNSGEQSHPRLKWVASWSHELWALYPCIKWQVQVILFDTVLLKCAQQKCFCTHTIIIKITIIICIYIYIFMHNHMHNIYIYVFHSSLCRHHWLIDWWIHWSNNTVFFRVFPLQPN